MRARGGDDVLLDHDAAHVVAAEPQPELAGLQSLASPRRTACSRCCRGRCAKSPASSGTRPPVASSFTKRPSEVFSRWKDPGDERREPAGLFLRSGARSRSDSCAARSSRRSRTSSSPWCACRAACAVRCTSIHSCVRALQAADAVAHGVVQNLGAAAGNRIEAGIAQPRDRVAQDEPADLGDVGDLRAPRSSADES